ncbi:Pyridoxal phosphate-dependent transferase, major region, subdomain 1 [Akanthomyces lecanii RCEF 1005]|uniref:Pyridoxal phosphate-dependent transferase, major region, subdomain 1 n=1 Tax=Akanthomyces lecanii RCEF 1005 TaxID=1081108 RepID=A0A168C9H1_CORDF|nr:Pyridoxal phosphate-dependent transferase, major region, subdomain 1 [Akanthomyces lecanii RCEF 1005]
MKPGSQRMDSTFSGLLDKREAQGRRRRLTLPPPGAVDFSSNSYLSLADSPELKRHYLALLQSSGDGDGPRFSLGSGGSRLLDGNTAFTEALERRIAAFHGAPAGLLFNSGFDANAGLFGCAPQPGDAVVYDELIHASVHDGMKLGRAQKVPFTHNTVHAADAEGGTESLSAVLDRLCQGSQGESFRNGSRNIFVAVEGVYSMDGDVAPLRDIVACVRERLPRGNGHIIVDEAHSTGIIGPRGRGLVCHLGLEDQIWVRVHTFGKAMGCAGAIVLCSPISRAYLINYARSLIYTTALGYPSLAAIQITPARADPPRARHPDEPVPAAPDPAAHPARCPLGAGVAHRPAVHGVGARARRVLPAARLPATTDCGADGADGHGSGAAVPACGQYR